MKVVRTASVKLDLDPQNFQILLNTIKLYTQSYNFVCSVGFENNITNGITLHKLTYNTTREYLPSQLSISSRAQATETLLSLSTKKRKNPSKSFKCPNSKQMSIRLDKNSHTIWFDKQIVSILSCEGRLRLPFTINPYFKQFINWKHSSAQLVLRNKKFLLNVQFEKDVEDLPKTGKYLGIDRGIRKLAVCSNNKFYSGGQVRRTCQKYLKLRKKLQECGSRSAKRHLCRVSGKEKRFKSDVNHQISKNIVSMLNPGDTIVLESLSGIRNKRLRKKQRAEVNSWNYLQLEQYLTYKAMAKSVHIEHVDARYTSQRCSKCGHIARSNRKTQSGFRCTKCNFTLNADLNAARNIVVKYLDSKSFFETCESKGVEVNQPNVRPVFLGRPAKNKPLPSGRGY